MLLIDGSRGEGGGQIVRSSLALSVVTETPLQLVNIRARRKQPGLKQQHLTAVQAAATICQAEVEGAAVGARQLVFRPGPVRGGRYHFRVGTAGSATLVLQTVLPALLTAPEASHLVVEGGTHNPWAPPFDFLARAYLPLVRRMGPQVEATLQRPGFFPKGGGRFTVDIEPAKKLQGFDLLERGQRKSRAVRAIVAGLPQQIAQRECDTIRQKTDWPEECFAVQNLAERYGPGNVVLIELEFERLTEIFTGFGQRGVRAEKVAGEALREAQAFLAADVPVGPRLADQLILPLAISTHQGGGGGTFRTMPLSQHSTTHIDIVREFLNVEIDVREPHSQQVEVHIRLSA